MPGVGTQLRKISNDVIFSDISVTLNPSKTGVLSNGDQITFEVQLLDEFGDAFDEAPGFSALARFNGQQLDWVNSSADTKRATYTVSARDPLDNDPELHSLMIVTEDGSISNYGSFVVSEVTAIEPNRNSLSDWSVISVAYETSNNTDDPEIIIEVEQTGASLAEDAIVIVESPQGYDMFEVNHGSVNSNQIISHSFSLDSSSPLNLGTGIEPEGDWYFTWVPMIDSDKALDDAARDNNTKHEYYNQTPGFTNLPSLIAFNRLDETRNIYLNIDDENFCSTQMSLLSAGDSAIASVKLASYECGGTLEIKSVDYGITTFSLRLVDEEGKGVTYITQVEVQTDHITSSIRNLRILPEQSLQIPFSVALDPNASYAFLGSHSNTGIVSSFGSLVGSGSPNFAGQMTLVAGASTGSDNAQIQLFRDNVLVNVFDINVEVTDEPFFSNPRSENFSDGAETITTNEGYATTFYMYDSIQQNGAYYIAGIDGQGFRDGLALKIDSDDDGYPSDILYFEGSYYLLWSVYNENAGKSELQILRLEEDGSIDWRRTFDLQGHSFMNGRLHNSNDSKLLVSIHAYDWDNDTNLLGWQKLSGSEAAADTKFSNYPSQIATGDFLQDVELHEQTGEIVMTWLDKDESFTSGKHLMASRWNSINQSQLSSSQLLSGDLIIKSMGLTNSLTSIYFFSRQVSVNTSNQITDTKLSVIQFSSGQVKEEYEVDMDTALSRMVNGLKCR